MSEETPRLSRRQLREQGKLEAVPADGPSVLDTTELRLRRPSRKELRELESRQLPAVSASSSEADDYIGQPTQAMDAIPAPAAVPPVAADEPIQHERKSVFDRFEDHDAKSALADQNADQAVDPDGAERVPAQDPVEEETDNGDDSMEEESLRDRFLAMTRREDKGSSVALVEGTPAAGEDEVEETEYEAPRRTWLNVILLILIAGLVGYLGGSWINVTFLSDAVPGAHETITEFLL
ncbi:hypothetical protein [Trueperella pecoris]|uniref:Uncharacterized protein n=1 Tax=Trueperella pecoris TaxID=2733571 RepID=A0A7M1QUP9_9ACTO|nr:hypothetical protein [Trueperella pecoris]QOQ38619.1 hypothetical protein HLG82_03580 [Trueperella pecoris]QOR44887.1 hypothetical protein INS88_06185 [Trueperella pecoris]QTG74797.1 hypothetical protein J4179_06035 [Trueperella pecoris]